MRGRAGLSVHASSAGERVGGALLLPPETSTGARGNEGKAEGKVRTGLDGKRAKVAAKSRRRVVVWAVEVAHGPSRELMRDCLDGSRIDWRLVELGQMEGTCVAECAWQRWTERRRARVRQAKDLPRRLHRLYLPPRRGGR